MRHGVSGCSGEDRLHKVSLHDLHKVSLHVGATDSSRPHKIFTNYNSLTLDQYVKTTRLKSASNKLPCRYMHDIHVRRILVKARLK